MKAKPPIQAWVIDIAMRYAKSPAKSLNPITVVVHELAWQLRHVTPPPANAWEKLRGILDNAVATCDLEAFDALNHAWTRKTPHIIIDGKRLPYPRPSTFRHRRSEVIQTIKEIQEREGRAPTLGEITLSLRGDRKKIREVVKELGWLDKLSEDGRLK